MPMSRLALSWCARARNSVEIPMLHPRSQMCCGPLRNLFFHIFICGIKIREERHGEFTRTWSEYIKIRCCSGTQKWTGNHLPGEPARQYSLTS
jgi:hypothetical protein